jgi:hypothetical protein
VKKTKVIPERAELQIRQIRSKKIKDIRSEAD